MADTVKIENFANIDLEKYTILSAKVIDGCHLTLFATKSRSAAYLLADASKLGGLSLERIVEYCRAASIPLTNEAQTRLTRYLANSGKIEGEHSAVMIAQGREPVPGQDSRVEWHIDEPDNFNVGTEGADGRVDYRERRTYVNVKAGQHILTVHPPIRGEPGYDIKGVAIPPRDGQWRRPLAGDGIIADQSQTTMHAAIDGVVMLRDNRVHVRRILTVNNVDFQTGNIHFDGDVHVGGSVTAGFSVETKGSVTIDGNVESGSIRGHNVVIRGATTGAQVRAEGRVELGRVEGGAVRGDQGVVVAEDAVNPTVHCGGRLSVKGRLVGGRVNALGGVEAGWLGGKEGGGTHVVVDPERCELPCLDDVNGRIGARREKLEKIEQALGPLKSDTAARDRLPPERRDAVKKLLSTHSNIEFDLDVQLAERTRTLEPHAARALYSVNVARGVSQGVEVGLKNVKWAAEREMTGAWKLALTRDGASIEARKT